MEMRGNFCELPKYFYGFKQAAKVWHSLLRENFLSRGFQQSTMNLRQFYKGINTEFVALFIAVDNIAFASK